MIIKGRHVSQDQNMHNQPEYAKKLNRLNKQAKFVGEITQSGTIRLDCENHPEFWMEIILTNEEIAKLFNRELVEKFLAGGYATEKEFF